jgi:hypothetical protein
MGDGTSLPGVKFDGEKAKWDLLPMRAVSSVVDVLTFGARKYAPWNWARVPDQRPRYYAACLRHLVAWWHGERLDPDSGLPHLAHAVCCLLFLLEVEQARAAGCECPNPGDSQSEHLSACPLARPVGGPK